MIKKRIEIGKIPTIIWGNNSSKVFIAVHGNMSNKEDEVIRILTEMLTEKGYQVLSFDLPEHGERKDIKRICNVQNCIEDLKTAIEYAKNNYTEINLWACSMGAYFSLLAFNEENIKKCLFISPVVDMEIIIKNLMNYANVTEEELQLKKEIKTDFGQTLYWDYYKYVIDNPIKIWHKNTCILYGERDNLQNLKTLVSFSHKFDCFLSIMKNGEHFFHTKEQIEYYKKWLNLCFKNEK